MKKAYMTFILLSLLTIIKGQTPKDTLPSIYLKSNMGFLIGTVESEMKAPFSFLTDFNVGATKEVHLGVGTGLEFFQTTYIPAYLTISAKPFSRNVIISIAGGYTFPLNKRVTFTDGYDYKFSEGYFLNPEISYFFHKLGNKHSFVVGVGYRYQRTDAKRITENINPLQYYPPYYDYTLITVLNRFSLRIGYLFY